MSIPAPSEAPKAYSYMRSGAVPLNVSRIILATYLRGAPTSTAVGLFGGIHPAQHFLEVVYA